MKTLSYTTDSIGETKLVQNHNNEHDVIKRGIIKTILTLDRAARKSPLENRGPTYGLQWSTYGSKQERIHGWLSSP